MCARRRWRGCKLGYDVVRAINPRLVYAGVFGFGQDGPYAAKPAYDDLIQGATALPALIAQTGDGTPRYVPNALVDRIVGLTAVGAICASLVASRAHRPRPAHRHTDVRDHGEVRAGRSSRGAHYEPPLDQGGYARLLSRGPPTLPDKRRLYLRARLQRQAVGSFFHAIGRDDLRTDRGSQPSPARHHIDVVYAELASIFVTRTTAEWTALLDRPTCR